MRASMRVPIIMVAFSAANAFAGPVLQTELIPPPERIEIRTPLEFEIRIRNAGDADTGPIGIYSDYFALTHYAALSDEGCELDIFAPNPLPGHPEPLPIFGFSWFPADLAPGEALACRIRLPYTAFLGTETIGISSIVNGVHRHEASFTYTLVAPPQPVPAMLPPAIFTLILTVVAIATTRRIGTRSRGQSTISAGACHVRASQRLAMRRSDGSNSSLAATSAMGHHASARDSALTA